MGNVYTNPPDTDGDHFFVETEVDGRFLIHVTQVSGGVDETTGSYITVEQVEAMLAAMKAHESPPKTMEEVEAWLKG